MKIPTSNSGVHILPSFRRGGISPRRVLVYRQLLLHSSNKCSQIRTPYTNRRNETRQLNQTPPLASHTINTVYLEAWYCRYVMLFDGHCQAASHAVGGNTTRKPLKTSGWLLLPSAVFLFFRHVISSGGKNNLCCGYRNTTFALSVALSLCTPPAARLLLSSWETSSGTI